ncbi:MAG: tetratricopeptide repeat protein [Gammaproteobacteria bacterium]
MSTEKPDLTPLCLRARDLIRQGRMPDALGLYDDVLKIDPDFAMAHADKGTALAMMKQFDDALAELEKAFALGYAEASAYTTAGSIRLEQRQYQQALAHYAKAIELNPDYPFTYFNRANAYRAIGDKANALADLKTCLSFGGAEDFRQLVMKRIAEVERT